MTVLVKDDRVREEEVTHGDNAAAQESASEVMTVPVEDAHVQGIAPEAVIDPENVVTAATIVENIKALYLSECYVLAGNLRWMRTAVTIFLPPIVFRSCMRCRCYYDY